MLDESVAEVVKRSLRERRLGRAQATEHHLPAEVDHALLNGFRVRRLRVCLKQHDHRHERRRMSSLARAGLSVDGRQLFLERLVEQLQTVHSQEAKQLLGPLHRLQKHPLLRGQILRGLPSQRRHLDLQRGQRITSARGSRG